MECFEILHQDLGAPLWISTELNLKLTFCKGRCKLSMWAHVGAHVSPWGGGPLRSPRCCRIWTEPGPKRALDGGDGWCAFPGVATSIWCRGDQGIGHLRHCDVCCVLWGGVLTGCDVLRHFVHFDYDAFISGENAIGSHWSKCKCHCTPEVFLTSGMMRLDGWLKRE